MKKNVGILILLSLGLFGVLGSACEGNKITVAGQNAEVHGISVSGEGKATGVPDIAMLSLGVSSVKPTVKDARDDAASTMQKVVDAIKADGVADKDVQTSQYSISPEYDYSQNGSKLTGYRVTNTVTVKVRDVDKTSQVLDDVAAAGGDIVQVQGVSFTIDDPKALQDQAREEAVKDAKARAQRLADTAGVKLGDPISIQEGSSTQPMPMDVSAGAALKETAPSTPIMTGELDVDLTVQVVFAIE